MEGVFLALVVVGSVMSFAAGIWFLVAGFKTHVGWGIAFLVPCVGPIAGLVFLVKCWERAKKPFFLNLLSVVFMIGVCGLGMLHSVKDLHRQEEENPEIELESVELPPFISALVKLSGGSEEFEVALREQLEKWVNASGEAEGNGDSPSAPEEAVESTEEPKSGLAGMMAAAKAKIEQADDRAKETGDVIDALTKKPEPEKAVPESTKPDVEPAAEAKPEEAAKDSMPKDKGAGAAESDAAKEPEPEPVADTGGYAAAPRGFAVVSLIGTENRRTAMITGDGVKNYLVGKGDKLQMKLRDGSEKEVSIIDIKSDMVIIQQKGWAVQWAIPAPRPKD